MFISFNAARGFVGGAAAKILINNILHKVSMPHAALWVVQPLSFSGVIDGGGFNAARGFVGGAAITSAITASSSRFQCRTRLCGWCSKHSCCCQ